MSLKHRKNKHPAANPGDDTKVKAEDARPDVLIKPGAPCPQPSPRHCEITCKKEKAGWDQFKPYVECVGLIALVVYTAFTGYMYFANKEAADAAMSAANTASETLKFTVGSARLDQRAWVGIKDSEFTPFEAGKIPAVHILLYNSGKTVARDLDVPGFFCVSDKAGQTYEEIVRDLSPRLPNMGLKMGALFPGTDLTVNAFGSTGPLKQETIDGINAGTLFVYAGGECNYADVFGVRHTTQYFFIYNTQTKRLSHCPTHNDAN